MTAQDSQIWLAMLTSILNRELHWDILVLQIMDYLTPICTAAVAVLAANFIYSYVHALLTQQQISCPAMGSATLDFKEFLDHQQYAGQALDTGSKAHAHANGFIDQHLDAVAGRQTYPQLSARVQARPSDAKAVGDLPPLFQGETLRQPADHVTLVDRRHPRTRHRPWRGRSPAVRVGRCPMARHVPGSPCRPTVTGSACSASRTTPLRRSRARPLRLRVRSFVSKG